MPSTRSAARAALVVLAVSAPAGRLQAIAPSYSLALSGPERVVGEPGEVIEIPFLLGLETEAPDGLRLREVAIALRTDAGEIAAIDLSGTTTEELLAPGHELVAHVGSIDSTTGDGTALLRVRLSGDDRGVVFPRSALVARVVVAVRIPQRGQETIAAVTIASSYENDGGMATPTRGIDESGQVALLSLPPPAELERFPCGHRIGFQGPVAGGDGTRETYELTLSGEREEVLGYSIAVSLVGGGTIHGIGIEGTDVEPLMDEGFVTAEVGARSPHHERSGAVLVVVPSLGGAVVLPAVATIGVVTVDPEPEDLRYEPSLTLPNSARSVDTVLTVGSGNHYPCTATLRAPEPPPPERFRRGDANGDTAVNIADALRILIYLFGDGAAFPCDDASDSNDDGQINISDGVTILNKLFGGDSPEFAAPGRHTCGPDPTADALGCAETPCD